MADFTNQLDIHQQRDNSVWFKQQSQTVILGEDLIHCVCV